MPLPSIPCAASQMARFLLRNRIVPALPRCTAAQQQNTAGGSKSDTGFCPQRSHLSALPAKPTSDAELLAILDDKLYFAERASYFYVREKTEGYPFEIQDDNGKSIVTMRRRHHREDIEVTLGTEYSVTRKEHDAMNLAAECYRHSSGSESDDESCLYRVPLTVRVRKGERSPSLEFVCTSSPDSVIIDAVYLKHDPSNWGMRAYEGPDFNGLNKGLQKSFYKYLHRRLRLRGISSLGGISSYVYYFHIYMVDKKCRDRRHWLRSMKQFVEK